MTSTPNSESPASEASDLSPSSAQAEEGKEAASSKVKAKAKAKEAKVEDKPFAEFIQQDYLPALDKALTAQNLLGVTLSFEDNQVTGRWLEGRRQFTVYFPDQDINRQRAFSCAFNGNAPTTFEPFLGDERRITLDLLVFGVIQRLNAQKWFGKN
jgi:hypothetical protein